MGKNRKKKKQKVTLRMQRRKFAVKMKQEPTIAEAMLLYELKLLPGKECPLFTTQKLLLTYILDFWFPEARLCVEVDGRYHERTVIYDHRRDRDLLARGVQTLRIRNADVLRDAPTMARKVAAIAKERATGSRKAALELMKLCEQPVEV